MPLASLPEHKKVVQEVLAFASVLILTWVCILALSCIHRLKVKASKGNVTFNFERHFSAQYSPSTLFLQSAIFSAIAAFGQKGKRKNKSCTSSTILLILLYFYWPPSGHRPWQWHREPYNMILNADNFPVYETLFVVNISRTG